MKNEQIFKNKQVQLSCDYSVTKKNRIIYKGFVAASGKIKKVFNTSNPVEDWKSLKAFMIAQGASVVLEASSINHFTMDVPGYTWNKDGDLVKA